MSVNCEGESVKGYTLTTTELSWKLLVVECSAFLASGSDPTVPKLIAILEFCM